MGVALVTPVESTVERFVARVDVRVFLPIGAVGEAAIAALEFTAKRFLACQGKNNAEELMIIVLNSSHDTVV